jgi:methionine-rich copper-binding protein CopC
MVTAMNPAVRRPGTTLLLAVMFTLALVTLTPRASYAHTQLTASLPAAGAVVGTMPDRVLLTFSDPLDPTTIRVDVTGPDRSPAIAGPVSVRGKTAQQPVRAGGNGTYTVSYEVVSADTHVVTGTLTFTLRPGAPPAPSEPVVVAPAASRPADAPGGAGRTAGAAPAGGGSGGGLSWWLWLLPIVAGAAAAAIYLLVRRRRAQTAPPADEGVGEAPPADEGVGTAPPTGDEGVGTAPPTGDEEGVGGAPPAGEAPPAEEAPPAGEGQAPRGDRPEDAGP